MMSEPAPPVVLDLHGSIVNRLLRALDDSIAESAHARGLKACNGRDDAPCEIGALHSPAALLANRLASAICDPHSDEHPLVPTLCDLLCALRVVFPRRPTG